MWVVTSTSPATPHASYVSTVSTAPCQPSASTHPPQKKKTRRAGRRVRATRLLHTNSCPPSEPSTVPPITADSPKPPSCHLEEEVKFFADFVTGLFDLLRQVKITQIPKQIEDLQSATNLEIAYLRKKLYDLEEFLGFSIGPPVRLTEDSQHLKPP